ncbi:MAG: hypothetical protein ABI444_05950, partial [Candidatus Kapaibacterium sp.]
MKALFLLAVLIAFSVPTLHAQTVVGDTSYLGGYALDDAECIMFSNRGHSNSQFFDRATQIGTTAIVVDEYFAPIVADTLVDDATDTTQWGRNIGWCCDCKIIGHHTFSARAISDSMVRIRPQNWQVRLDADTAKAGWFGSSDQIFDNNIGASTTFNNWTISEDSGQVFQIAVFDGINQISSYTALPFQRRFKLHYVISTSRGPTSGTKMLHGKIETVVHTPKTDSNYISYVTFVQTSEPFAWGAFADTSLIGLHAELNKTDSAIVNIHFPPATKNLHYNTVAPPFRTTELHRDDTLLTLRIYANASTGGVFADDLMIYGSFPDLNHDERVDSVRINLQATVNSTYDVRMWEQAGIKDSQIIGIASNISRVIVSTNSTALSSYDHGDSWSRFIGPDSTAMGPYQMDDSGYVYHVVRDQTYFAILDPFATAWRTNIAISFWYYGTFEIIPAWWVISGGGHLAVQGYGYYRLLRDQTQRIASGQMVSSNHGSTWLGNIQDGSQYGCTGSRGIDSSGSIFTPSCGYEALGLDAKTNGIIAFDASNNYFLGVHNMLYRSTNLGSTWARVRVFPSDIVDIATSPDGTIWVAASGNGIYQSKDTGNNWIGIN